MGIFKQLWEVYKENGCEMTLHRTITTQLGTGISMSSTTNDADAVAASAFVSEMEAYLRDPDMFLLMLSVGLGGMFDTQSSFVGLLLREDVLQERIIDFLLEKLSEYASEFDSLATRAMEKNIPKLILREIRWIDHVVDSGDLVEKLVSSLPAFPVSLQRDLIYILPEIASDEDAHVVIDAMLELIRNEAELVVSCIEALGNFNVENEQTGDVVKCVLERLDSSPLVDLPVIVKYLVQEAPGADIELIVGQLRERLSMTLSFPDTAVEASNNTNNAAQPAVVNELSGNEEALVLGAIIQGFYFREDLMKAFVTSISKCGETSGGAGSLRLLDMWVLMAAHSIPRDRLKLEKIFKKKVTMGLITRGLMVRSVKGHSNALTSFFGSLLQLASMLIMQQTSATCMEMGSLMYEVLFEEFSRCRKDGKSQAAYYQGQIVTSLLGYCLSATSDTTNAAFHTLLVLLSPSISFQNEMRDDRRYDQSHFKRRFRFELFLPALKQLLDAMEICTLDQVRQVYQILFAVGGPDDTELCNTLRKQTFHQETRFRLYGIIGSVTRVNHLLLQYREDTTANDEPVAAQTFNKCVVDLFEGTVSQGKCVAFMLSELWRWVKDVTLDRYATVLVNIISERAMYILESDFLVDYDVQEDYRKPVLGGAMKTDLWMGLDDQRSVVYLKVFDLAVSPNVREQESLHHLSALVELVLECARKTDTVPECDALLICPIQLMEKSVIEDIAGLDDATQNAVCSAVWHSINWIRSILGFYAGEKRSYHSTKVIQRLENLVFLETTLLDDLLHACALFGPPGMQFSEASHALTGKTLNTSTKKKAGRPAKISPTVDRAVVVRRSFNPMTADVLKILAIPALWEMVWNPTSSTAFSASTEGSHTRPEVLVEVLMVLFVDIASTAKQEAKKRSHVLPFATVFSEASGWTKSATTLTEAKEITGVLEHVCLYAHRFAHILTEIKSNREDDDDAETDATIERIAKNVVHNYLKVGDVLFGGSQRTHRGNSMLEATQRCQDFFLPREQRVDLQASADDSITSHVLESCFLTASRMTSAVGDDIELATELLRVLLAIASVAYGFPADQAAIRSTIVSLKLKDQERPIAEEMSAKISSMALSFLQKDWSGGDKKFVHKSADLDVFLTSYLQHGRLLLDNVQSLALDGILALIENGGNETEAFPTLSKKTIPSFHRVMFETLVIATARLDFDDKDDSISTRTVTLLLNYFMQAVLLFKLLVGITRTYQKSKLVSAVLKLGRKFLEVVVRAMPFFQRHFVDHNELIMKMISEVQIATRRMQVLCAHGKLIKDATAAAQVPMVKRLLERFIYRAEELARTHGVMDAFSTGVLKNRRIDGTTISKAELAAMEADNSDSSEESDAETQAGAGASSTEEEEKEEEAIEDQHQEDTHSEDESSRPHKKRK